MRSGSSFVTNIILVTKKTFLILYNIRSAYNVGAIFRTADAVGISKIYLVGVTPCPADKFGRVNSQIAKTALGAEKTVAWEYKKTIAPLMAKLKKDGAQVVALEQDEEAIDYRKLKPKGDWALILGEETKGLSKAILSQSDSIVEIPMKGKKESLNVSVAAGVALFQIIGNKI
ncbi:MAG: hypothetical protein A2571_00840 [Candidatus Vogelbacteria bacterium RIFOXYD1_FULL_44_32]|uniref:tRNA/rRNA methyltransferase SpoU type domain-containing protein n=1 Tax=Candidatus Vogelbacteria bacterium RIFOXYD1_FULL_44_32 TaxID=1802438 RepID=A0A1G2QG14_9BACT|nr:MAG: hypothetical protein A2571_00840 [Candidatus Vogelbacteria bacterium RIFOXYD1_FULL_44_32]